MWFPEPPLGEYLKYVVARKGLPAGVEPAASHMRKLLSSPEPLCSLRSLTAVGAETQACQFVLRDGDALPLLERCAATEDSALRMLSYSFWDIHRKSTLLRLPSLAIHGTR